MSYLDFGEMEAETMKELVIEALMHEVASHTRTKAMLEALERQANTGDAEIVGAQMQAEAAEKKAAEMEAKLARLLVVCEQVLTENQFNKVRMTYENFDEHRAG